MDIPHPASRRRAGDRTRPTEGRPDHVVEVGHSWFNRIRRLLVRWEKRAATYLGFVHLAACLIVYRKVRHARSRSG